MPTVMNMLSETDKAYLAGVIDSDGYISIRMSTYGKRKRADTHNPVFSERIGLKQVQPQAVLLFHDAFAGSRSLQKPTAKRGKPLYGWEATCRQAAKALRILLPYLRIKRAQADIALRLRDSKDTSAMRTHAYWWEEAEDEEWLPVAEGNEIMGYAQGGIEQAIRLGTVPSKRVDTGQAGWPRVYVPRSFCEYYGALRRAGRNRSRPPQLIAHQTALLQEVRALNDTRRHQYKLCG